MFLTALILTQNGTDFNRLMSISREKIKEEYIMIGSAAAEEKRIAFWTGKITELLKGADGRQLELIYGFTHAYLEKFREKVN